METQNTYEAGGDDIVKNHLHGGNMPQAGPGQEEFMGDSSGSLGSGLCCKTPFMDMQPEELGMGTAGPNQVPIGPAEHAASRGHKFG